MTTLLSLKNLLGVASSIALLALICEDRDANCLPQGVPRINGVPPP